MANSIPSYELKSKVLLASSLLLLAGSLVVVVVQMTATAVNYNLLIAVELAIAKISTVNGNSTAHFATATTKIPADNCS